MTKSVFTLSDGATVTSVTPQEREQREAEEFNVQDFVNDVQEALRSNKIYLPTLPTVALEALLVINDANSSAADLEKVISQDAALTARLIRYANSPLYMGVTKVTAIKLAITRIGFQRVKNAVYAVSMKEVFRTPIKAIESRMEALWVHSVQVAAKAAMIAKDHTHLDPDVALVAGLVHDIGYIPLLVKACEYEELSEKPDYLDRLTRKLHIQVGRSIAKRWQFDDSIVAVVSEHENLKRDPGDAPVDYVDLVQAANILAHEGADHPLASVDRSKVKAFVRLGLVESALPQLDEDTRAVEALLK
jgi:putative nucleotidyltransferase with HDIG domain